MAKPSVDEMETFINNARKNVNYDTKEFTLELLHSKFNRYIEENRETEVFIPFYQRKFVWNDKRQSKFIESMLLGLPIPPMYFAEIEEGILEVIDGSQRIRTINRFLNDDLKLKGLETLSQLNGLRFNDFKSSRKRKVNNISMRAIVVYNIDIDEMGIRHEIFERLNTGGEILKKMEVKKGAKEGQFIRLIYEECAEYSLFNDICGFTTRDELRAYKEEFLVKLFAFSEDMEFEEFINEYLDDFIENTNELLNEEEEYDNYLDWFKNLITFVSQNNLVQDISINRKNRLLAIFIGAAMAEDEHDDLFERDDIGVNLYSDEFLQNAKSSAFGSLKTNARLVCSSLLGAIDE